MESFKKIRHLGAGSFGSVWKAQNQDTGEVVAIKKLMNQKFGSWDECMNLREVKSLRKLNNHPNIVKLKDVIREDDELYFVFEYVPLNLAQVIQARKTPFSEDRIRNWVVQILHALEYMHRHFYFHRDLKPENLLVTKDHSNIKIADFGSAREVYSRTPYTEYVTTRWYRAPEVLLRSPNYCAAVDIWAVGAIVAELFTRRPLFPGTSQVLQIHKICGVLGSPSHRTWPDGMRLAESMNFYFPRISPTPGRLSQLIPNASPEAIDLISAMCAWDPRNRPTAFHALQHPFFQVNHKRRVPLPIGGCEHEQPKRFRATANSMV